MTAASKLMPASMSRFVCRSVVTSPGTGATWVAGVAWGDSIFAGGVTTNKFVACGLTGSVPFATTVKFDPDGLLVVITAGAGGTDPMLVAANCTV